MAFPLLMVIILFLGIIPVTTPSPSSISMVAVVSHPLDISLEKIRDVARLDSIIGDVVTLETTTWGLDYLKSSDVVKSVNSPRMFRAMLEISTVDIGLPELLEKSGLNIQRVDGSGVLIAIIDTGVDYLHPAFLDEENRSRVLYIWDQTIQGRPPDGFNYGHECGPEEINSGSCPEVDTNGHGTHVASIAAGSHGVARKASLLVVKSGGPACGGGLWTFDEKGILDGLAYAASKARSLGMRLVVNLSLGTDIGAHDGSSSLERALDHLVDEGVVVVVAAGNSASDGRHVTGMVMEGANVGLRWNIPGETSEFSISVVTGPRENLSLAIAGPDVDNVLLLGNSSSSADGFVISMEEYVGKVSHRLVTVKGNVRGIWVLNIVGEEISDGLFNAWLESDTCSSTRETFTTGAGYEISDGMTVSIPGTAEKVITVGAYMTRNRWVTQSGRTVDIGGVAGSLEYYSGRGPTADGRIKPEIVAPGGVIIAAKSRHSAGSQLNPSPLERVGRGTSMATPHVAGVAALILQLSPILKPADVAEIIKGVARHDNFTGGIRLSVSNEWGWGKLNADIAYLLPVTVNGLSQDLEATLIFNSTRTPLTSQPAILLLPKVLKTDLALNITAKSSGVRAEASPERMLVSEDSTPLFQIITSYYVQVYSSLGDRIFADWVPKGASLDLRELTKAELRTSTPLVRRNIVAYVADDGSLLSERIVVDKPLTLTLALADDYSDLFIVIMAPAVIAAAIYLGLVLRAYRRRR